MMSQKDMMMMIFFYYGLSEDDLKNSSKDDILEFVITDYEPVSKNYSKGGKTPGYFGLGRFRKIGSKLDDLLSKRQMLYYDKAITKRRILNNTSDNRTDAQIKKSLKRNDEYFKKEFKKINDEIKAERKARGYAKRW